MKRSKITMFSALTLAAVLITTPVVGINSATAAEVDNSMTTSALANQVIASGQVNTNGNLEISINPSRYANFTVNIQSSNGSTSYNLTYSGSSSYTILKSVVPGVYQVTVSADVNNAGTAYFH